MAAGSTVIASFDKNTDLEKILIKYKIGRFCEADNVSQLTDAILEAYKNKDDCIAMGQRARKYVENKMSRQYGVNEYIRIVSSVFR